MSECHLSRSYAVHSSDVCQMVRKLAPKTDHVYYFQNTALFRIWTVKQMWLVSSARRRARCLSRLKRRRDPVSQYWISVVLSLINDPNVTDNYEPNAVEERDHATKDGSCDYQADHKMPAEPPQALPPILCLPAPGVFAAITSYTHMNAQWLHPHNPGSVE